MGFVSGRGKPSQLLGLPDPDGSKVLCLVRRAEREPGSTANPRGKSKKGGNLGYRLNQMPAGYIGNGHGKTKDGHGKNKDEDGPDRDETHRAGIRCVGNSV